MWRLADEQLDTFVDRGLMRIPRGLREAVLAVGHRRSSRRACRGPRRVPCRLRRRTGRPARRRGADDAQPVAMAERQVPRLHRGSQAPATCRRPDRTGAGEVRRRIDSGHRRRDEPVDVPVRGGHRDDDEAASARRCAILAENPEYETYLREDRGRIPAFLEETLRMESPVKSHFRMARTSTTIGDTEIPAGTTVMLLPGACNRDRTKVPDPHTFRPDRRNVREQIAFVRGVHSCPGAPLARAEGRDLAESDSGPDDRLHGFRRSTTARRRRDAIAMSPRSSCVGWQNCTWSSSRTRKSSHIATLFT